MKQHSKAVTHWGWNPLWDRHTGLWTSWLPRGTDILIFPSLSWPHLHLILAKSPSDDFTLIFNQTLRDWQLLLCHATWSNATSAVALHDEKPKVVLSLRAVLPSDIFARLKGVSPLMETPLSGHLHLSKVDGLFKCSNVKRHHTQPFRD